MKPEFISEKNVFLRRQGPGLRALIGKPLEGCWLAWDRREDEWFSDEAVVLQFGAEQVEVVCSNLSDISLTRGRVDLRTQPKLVASWEGFELEWRRDCCPIIDRLKGRVLEQVGVVEFCHRTTVLADRALPSRTGEESSTWLLSGLRWTFGPDSFEIFNALDENGVAGPPFKGECRVTWL